jgi:hypothetical protein
VSRPALKPTHYPIQWAPSVLSPGVKRQGPEVVHSPHLVHTSEMTKLPANYTLYSLSSTALVQLAILFPIAI